MWRRSSRLAPSTGELEDSAVRACVEGSGLIELFFHSFCLHVHVLKYSRKKS